MTPASVPGPRLRSPTVYPASGLAETMDAVEPTQRATTEPPTVDTVRSTGRGSTGWEWPPLPLEPLPIVGVGERPDPGTATGADRAAGGAGTARSLTRKRRARTSGTDRIGWAGWARSGSSVTFATSAGRNAWQRW